jgi:hypothetical protein
MRRAIGRIDGGILDLGDRKRLVSRLSRFIPCAYRIADWIGAGTILGDVKKGKFLAPTGTRTQIPWSFSP